MSGGLQYGHRGVAVEFLLHFEYFLWLRQRRDRAAKQVFGIFLSPNEIPQHEYQDCIVHVSLKDTWPKS